ncbi:MAG: sodium/proton antiporter NhaB [Acidobacteriota bacterium]
MKLLFHLFMGGAPSWYKLALLFCLVLNPLLLATVGSFITGWILLIEFIMTLALALRCYPLLPGGLLALEAVCLGLASPEKVYEEAHQNFQVILLLIFMVAGVFFMKPFLSFVFTRLLVSIKNKMLLSLSFLFLGAFLSAWLDALTVMAVMIAVALSFYEVYNSVSYEARVPHVEDEHERLRIGHADLKEFSGFLRNILMHGAIGTALGGVSTLVGEPQNLLIGQIMGWDFGRFYARMAHISLPVQAAGLVTCLLIELFRLRVLGYNYQLPGRVRDVLRHHAERERERMSAAHKASIWIMALTALWLIVGLAFHLAAVGLIGLSVIVILTSLTGKDDEHQIGKAFEEALPFTALLVVFFAIVAMIAQQDLFRPVIDAALRLQGPAQSRGFFLASGILSTVSDNVFVATIYIQEAQKAFTSGLIDKTQFDSLAIAINAGTNIPSIATPNGQAAFLFLLTSSLSVRIQLSYFEMLRLAVPYTVVLSIVSYLAC